MYNDIPCPIPGHLAHQCTSHNGNRRFVIYVWGMGIGLLGPKTALTPTLYCPATLADPWYAQPPRPVAPAQLWEHEPQVTRPGFQLLLFYHCPNLVSLWWGSNPGVKSSHCCLPLAGRLPQQITHAGIRPATCGQPEVELRPTLQPLQ